MRAHTQRKLTRAQKLISDVILIEGSVGEWAPPPEQTDFFEASAPRAEPKPRKKRRPRSDEAREREEDARDEYPMTCFVPREVHKKLREIRAELGVPYNTLLLRGVALVLQGHGGETFEELCGEDPAQW